ncbi:hypothetical protein C8Q73DRAFT_804127 [Cubamyces lactineus]|nr:hypothetical protein C8Q73DRAFT_804127 [Cubamyces lactineus]
MSDVPVLQYIDNSELFFQVPPSLPTDLPDVSPEANGYLQALPVYDSDYSAITAPQWQLEYDFTGNYISVVGVAIPWVGGVLASAICTVDAQFQQTYTATQANTQPSVNVSYYTLTANQLINGKHTLRINITVATPESPFVLDYLVVGMIPDSTVPTSSDTSTASLSSTTSTNMSSSTSVKSTSTTTSKLSPTASDKPAGSSTSSSSFPLAPVRSLRDRREAEEAAAESKVPPADPPKGRDVVSPPPGDEPDDLVPSLPPGKGPMYTAGRVSPQPAFQPSMTGMHPSSTPYNGGQGQAWAQQRPSFSPPESRTQTVYSSNAPWEQWPGHSQTTYNQSQPGYTTPPPAPHAELAYHAGYSASAHMPSSAPPNFAPVPSISHGEFVPPAHSEPFTNVARAAAAAALSPGNAIGPAQAPAAPITAAFMVPPSRSPPPASGGNYAAARANAEHLEQRTGSSPAANSQARIQVEPSPGDPAHAAAVPSDVYSGIHAAQDAIGAPRAPSNTTIPSAAQAPAHTPSAPGSEAASLPRGTRNARPEDSSGDIPELTRRMHGGIMEYDGKESWLTSGRRADAVNDSSGAVSLGGSKAEAKGTNTDNGAAVAVARTGSGSDSGQRSNASSTSPPAYVP